MTDEYYAVAWLGLAESKTLCNGQFKKRQSLTCTTAEEIFVIVWWVDQTNALSSIKDKMRRKLF